MQNYCEAARVSSFKENTALAPPLNAKIINVIQQKTRRRRRVPHSNK